MIKKGLCILGLLFLTGCSRAMSGPSLTTCTEALSMYGDEETVVFIEGYDEEIVTWTIQSTFTRESFRMLVTDEEPLTDEEIADMVAYLNAQMDVGFELYLVTLEADEIVLSYRQDYALISDEQLAARWEVEDFEREITLSSAIRGLEAQGAVCVTTSED